MRKKLSWFWTLIFLLLVPLVSADIIMPFSFYTIMFFPAILIIEVVGFWLLANKVFNIRVSFWKSLLIVTVANVVTSLVGTIFPFKRSIILFLIAFILSVIIEFVIFLLFFIKKEIKKINLLWISGIINFGSYLVLYIILSLPI